MLLTSLNARRPLGPLACFIFRFLKRPQAEAARRRVDAALAELAQVQRATTQEKRELGKATAELEGVKAARAALDAF